VQVYNRRVKRALYDWGGVLAWLFVGTIVTFAATKHLWFDPLRAGEKALFWTNVLVAFGTLALALVTVASMLGTRAVIRGEDRRFQQSLAPYVTASFYTADLDSPKREEVRGFNLRNTGYGMARNIRVRIKAYYTPYLDGMNFAELLKSAKSAGAPLIRYRQITT
jgi:hypothetical protein